MSDTCKVCDEPIPDDYDKHDPDAPVYADEYVYHKGCESEVFETVFSEEPTTLEIRSAEAVGALESVAETLEQFAQHNQAAECRKVATRLENAIVGASDTSDGDESGGE